jgi:transcription initiation factor IIE alpha subunit
MATFWCPHCETTFQQDALSERRISCPRCLADLQPVVKVSDISALRRPTDHGSAGLPAGEAEAHPNR